MGLFVRVEARNAQLREPLLLDQTHVETADYEGREVEVRHFVEQAVGIDRVGGEHQDKEEGRLTLG